MLFDAVPQLANWYLPALDVALMPDAASRTALNAANPIWLAALRMPDWHVWYPTWGSGTWNCTNQCDYRATLVDAAHIDGPYDLRSERLGVSVRMCPVAAFPTTRMLNAPFDYLSTADLAPEGLHIDLMVLARPCASATSPVP